MTLRDLVRSAARAALPFAARVELVRLARWPGRVLDGRTVARRRAGAAERACFGHVLARHATPLERLPGQVAPALQRGKEHNVALAARRIDGLVLAPNEMFSYHRTVGRPSWLRGFRAGLELRDGRPSSGTGGGCCQVSNLLYWLALASAMRVVERHRHGVDLFPDHGRTVPFGCGATVFYDYADLRFENPLPGPVLLAIGVVGRELVGEVRAAEAPAFTVEVYEAEHRLWRAGEAEGGPWRRENRVRRRIRAGDGRILVDQEVAHNVARLLYEPADAMLQCSNPPGMLQRSNAAPPGDGRRACSARS